MSWTHFGGHVTEEREKAYHVVIISHRTQRSRELWVPKQFVRGGVGISSTIELSTKFAQARHLLRE